MEIRFSSKAIKDLEYWTKTGNKPIIKKISELLRAIKENPFEGIGKPEALKFNLTGVWSRRINKEHRLIYEIVDENTIRVLYIISVKGHYD